MGPLEYVGICVGPWDTPGQLGPVERVRIEVACKDRRGRLLGPWSGPWSAYIEANLLDSWNGAHQEGLTGNLSEHLCDLEDSASLVCPQRSRVGANLSRYPGKLFGGSCHFMEGVTSWLCAHATNSMSQ
jgi:hypothetical protein